MKRIAIVGTRPPSSVTYRDSLALRKAQRAEFDVIHEDVVRFIADLSDVVIISGGANGVDSIAENAARLLKLPVVIHEPDYEKYGPKRAPLERNTLIVIDCEDLHAWPSSWSSGTWDPVNKARASGKPLTVHEPWKAAQ